MYLTGLDQDQAFLTMSLTGCGVGMLNLGWWFQKTSSSNECMIK